MPSRTYAQIECGLPNSKKIRRLDCHKSKWAYVCAHLSSFCTYSGVFQYPQHMWAHDAGLSSSEVEQAIAKLADAGLVEFDPEEEFVRIVGWFRKKNGPENPNRATSIIRDLSDLEGVSPRMLCGSIAELSVSLVKRSRGWAEVERVRSELKEFLNQTLADHGEEILDRLDDELATAPRWVATELPSIFPTLSHHFRNPSQTVKEPFENPFQTVSEHETRLDADETHKKTRKNKKEDGGQKVSNVPTSKTSPPSATEEPLRKGSRPTASALNSPLARGDTISLEVR